MGAFEPVAYWFFCPQFLSRMYLIYKTNNWNWVKVSADTRQLKNEMASTVGDQATAERSSGKTMKEMMKLKQQVSKEEMLAIDLQNELAKLQAWTWPNYL